MREQLERIWLIILESGCYCDRSGASRIKVIWDNLWDKSLIICPYSYVDGALRDPHLTTNPYGCYSCSCEEYQGIDQDGEDVWLF